VRCAPPWRLDTADLLELDRRATQVVEEARALAEKDRPSEISSSSIIPR
jgi:hypothetical protein